MMNSSKGLKNNATFKHTFPEYGKGENTFQLIVYQATITLVPKSHKYFTVKKKLQTNTLP